MLLREFFINGINTKGIQALTEEQKQRLYEFGRNAGYKDDFNTWKESLTDKVDKKCEERYQQAVASGTRLSFEEYKEKVLNRG